MALAACPPKDTPVTTDDSDDETGAGASTSATTATPTTSGSSGTTTSETTGAASEPDTTTTLEPGSTSGPDATSSSSTAGDSTSTTTPEPDTTTGGEACPVDLTVTLDLDFEQCNEVLVVVATVHNMGSVDVPAGVEVSFFEGTDGSGLKLGAEPTLEPLPANSSTEVVWNVLGPNAPHDYYAEIGAFDCDETDNSAVITDAACPN